ncbi:MAG TPA: DUF58 domain-containing protein [Steroidobacteraceae bacterium]|nr:DUF58 domain-containing protein [Steroidobacteraceae bacterium]
MSLTARTLTLIALTLVLAIMGLWAQDETVGMLWRIPAALILTGLAVESFLARSRRFSLRVEVPARAYLGRSLPVHVVLENSERLPLATEFAVQGPSGIGTPAGTQFLRVRGHERAEATLPITPIRLGARQWPTVRARVLGLFGLAWWSRQVPQEAAVNVGPDLAGTAAQRAASANEGAMAGRARGSGAELHQLRPYRPGDPLHRIDWKATARRAGLITREFTEDQHLDVIVALDAGRSSRLSAGSLDRLGTFANVAARFAEHAIAHDDRIGLLVYAERVLSVVPPGRGHNAVVRVRDVLESLGHEAGAGAESSPLAAALRIRSLARHRSLVVLLTDLDDVTTGGELTRAVRLLQARHLVMVAGIAPHEIDALAAAPAQTWIDPYRSLAAREWQARSRAQLASLRSAGTPVVAARPSDLESAIFGYYARLRRARRV